MRFDTVLFDLDGTLVDSGRMTVAAFRDAARTVLGSDLSDERIHTAVGAATLGNVHDAKDLGGHL